MLPVGTVIDDDFEEAALAPSLYLLRPLVDERRRTHDQSRVRQEHRVVSWKQMRKSQHTEGQMSVTILPGTDSGQFVNRDHCSIFEQMEFFLNEGASW